MRHLVAIERGVYAAFPLTNVLITRAQPQTVEPKYSYKVHTILCRWSHLPLFFVVTPANCNDDPLAIPMFTAVVLLYHLRILIVPADAAHFNNRFLGFVNYVLHAWVNVDYNLRRQGKRFLADVFFIRQWRDLISPRANIERQFARMKRYFGLKYFRVQGYAESGVGRNSLGQETLCGF